MKNEWVFPCAEWAEKLAAMHPGDLPQADYVALEKHLFTCGACSAVRSQYQDLETLIRDLPADDMPGGIPPRLSHILNSQVIHDEDTSGLSNNDEGKAVSRSLAASRSLSSASTPSRRRRFRRFLEVIAAVLAIGMILAAVLWYLVASSPQNPVSSVGGASGAAVKIEAHPVFAQSEIFMGTGMGGITAFSGNDGLVVFQYRAGKLPLGTPAIVNGIIYASARDALYALRVSDGGQLWRYPITISSLQPPTVVDGVVYVTTSVHSLAALRASDGSLLWSFGVKNENEQVSEPVVAQGVAYVGVADQQDAYVVALNTGKGSLLWQRRVGEKYVALAIGGGVVYASSNKLLSALNVKDGSVLWQHQASGFSGSPTVANGVVYVVEDDGSIVALRANNGSSVWSYQAGHGATFLSSPIVVGGAVYFGLPTSSNLSGTQASSGYVYALRASNGQLLWQYNAGTNTIPSLTVGNGMVYLVSDDDTLVALKATTGTLVWKISLS